MACEARVRSESLRALFVGRSQVDAGAVILDVGARTGASRPARITSRGRIERIYGDGLNRDGKMGIDGKAFWQRSATGSGLGPCTARGGITPIGIGRCRLGRAQSTAPRTLHVDTTTARPDTSPATGVGSLEIGAADD
ncbi:MAG: hypothetical protein MZU91_12915 [Desulfosudis oleivorans]|nr:hypothetical protein [Desulfosudis oleivorans]